MRINKVAVTLLVWMGLAACKNAADRLPFYNTADFTARWIEEDDPGYAAIHTIDSFSLLSQSGHTITKDSLAGYIYVANFFFTTCPGICPKMVNNLQILQDTFAANSQVKLVSFTVMPWVDSVARLREYGENHRINPGKWYLLTGNQERIYKLGRQSYFSEKQPGLQKDSSEFLHTESMLLIDKKARIRGIYNATVKEEMQRVVDDINLLLKE